MSHVVWQNVNTLTNMDDGSYSIFFLKIIIGLKLTDSFSTSAMRKVICVIKWKCAQIQ